MNINQNLDASIANQLYFLFLDRSIYKQHHAFLFDELKIMKRK